MIKIKFLKNKIKLILCLLLLCFLLVPICAQTKLRVWGMVIPDRAKGQQAAIEVFEKRHNVTVEMLSMGAGDMNPQKLLTAVVGGDPPDVVFQDRFTIADWASRDTLTPLDKFVKRDRDKPYGVKREDYYSSAWNEATYNNILYGVPVSIDDRLFFYNKKLFREAGLDPEKPPRTWSELERYSEKLTKYKKGKGYEQIGFIPNFGNAWFYLYSWMMGGEFMSKDLKTCTMDNPQSLAALKWMVNFYDKYNGISALNSFLSGFSGVEFDPFMTGKIAMRIDGDYMLGTIARFHPSLDFGVAPPPIPDDRFYERGRFKNIDPKNVTWIGGFSYVIPRNAKKTDIAWEFIKWMTSKEACLLMADTQRKYNLERNRPFVPWMVSNKVANRAVIEKYSPKEEKYVKGLTLAEGMLEKAYHRPTVVVSQRLWDEHHRAFEQAVFHKKTPEVALKDAQRNIQSSLDKFYNKDKYPILNWQYPIFIVIGLFIILTVFGVLHIKRMKLTKLSKEEAVAALVCASPWLIGFLIFTIGPIIVSLIYSFCDYDVLHAARWVGINNYKEIVGPEWGYVSKSLYNAGYLALFGLPLGMVTSLSIALLLNTKIKGMPIFRTVYYLPSIMPIVATSILWMWMLNPEYGLINSIWKATLTNWFNIQAPLWLASEYTSKPALILMALWGAGGGMILWLAGLTGVPRSLYEAAEIDGASPWVKFWNVTIPMLTPYIFFNLIMGTIGVLQSFDAQYIMTGGGPVDSTVVPVLYLFKTAFGEFRMGYASAIAWVLFLIVFVLTFAQLKLSQNWVYYEGGEKK